MVKGQRIGQLIFTQAAHPPITQVKKLPASIRGTSGFGSTDHTSSKRLQTPFQPSVLQTIPEHGIDENDSVEDPELVPISRSFVSPTQPPPLQAKSQPKSFNVSDLTVDDLDSLLYPFRNEVRVEEVHEPEPEKIVFDDAIDMFATPYDSSLSYPPASETPSNNPEASSSPSNPPNEESTDHVTTAKTHQGPTKFYSDHEIGQYLRPVDDDTVDEGLALIQNSDVTPDKPTYAQIANPHYHIATIPPADRVSSTEPKKKTLTHDLLQQSIGFRAVERVIKQMTELAQPTINISDTGCDPFLSRGETATLPKKKRNTTPVPRPNQFGDIWHYDIVYGNGRAIGGFYYALLFVDRQSRFKLIEPLKNLDSKSIITALKSFR